MRLSGVENSRHANPYGEAWSRVLRTISQRCSWTAGEPQKAEVSTKAGVQRQHAHFWWEKEVDLHKRHIARSHPLKLALKAGVRLSARVDKQQITLKITKLHAQIGKNVLLQPQPSLRWM